jgi:hypothetical protein
MGVIRGPIALPCLVNVGVENYLTRHRSIGEMHVRVHLIITSDVKPFTTLQVSSLLRASVASDPLLRIHVA